MFSRNPAQSRFASMVHFGPARPPPLAQLLIGLGLVALGVGLGARLGPVFWRWRAQRGQPLLTAPVREIDSWANEGGAVAPPAFQKGP